MTTGTTLLLCTAAALAAGFLGGALTGGAAAPPPDTDMAELGRRLDALERRGPAAEARRRADDGDAGRSVPADVPASVPASVRAEASPAAEDPRFAEQARRIADLETRLDASARRTEELTVWAAGLRPAPRDEAAERRHHETLTTPALLDDLRKAARTPGRTPEERAGQNERVLILADVLLARTLEPAVRSEVLTVKGGTQRTAGDLDAAEATLREAAGLVAAESREGIEAAVQLMFNAQFRKDYRAAAEIALAVAARPSAPEVAPRFRRFAAGYLAQAGDGDQARTVLQSVVDEHGPSHDRHVQIEVAEARKQLAGLAGGPPR